MNVGGEVRDLSVRLGAVQALDSVSLTIDDGKFLSLLGPSGSGKTTMLNVLAGFIQPSEGSVSLGGLDMARVPPHKRDIGFVFQGYALFPHMTVSENVDFPLRMRGVSRGQRRARAQAALELTGLGALSNRRVRTLSGGQQQRVALARAVVFEPRILLLDEPLAALDKQLRESMQFELKRIQQSLGITTVSVTHDQVEAMTLADRIAVMRDGRIEQVGPPETVYNEPCSTFVASFLGEANLLPVHDGTLIEFGKLGQPNVSGNAVLRPESITLASEEAFGESALHAPASVEEVTFQGPRRRLRVRLQSLPESILTVTESAGGLPPVAVSDSIWIQVPRRQIHVIESSDPPAFAEPTDNSVQTRSQLESRGAVGGESCEGSF